MQLNLRTVVTKARKSREELWSNKPPQLATGCRQSATRWIDLIAIYRPEHPVVRTIKHHHTRTTPVVHRHGARMQHIAMHGWPNVDIGIGGIRARLIRRIVFSANPADQRLLVAPRGFGLHAGGRIRAGG